jgi:hypothetical protein
MRKGPAGSAGDFHAAKNRPKNGLRIVDISSHLIAGSLIRADVGLNQIEFAFAQVAPRPAGTDDRGSPNLFTKRVDEPNSVRRKEAMDPDICCGACSDGLGLG